ncbi:MAG: DNA phosphorothioation-dependent restriction protein DptG [Anaerobacillus sp.]|uniref:DNA phosphorothioation-dependent restriction protein DptG n=1 Tax=Anaerobacillus sp. TaxID=1872506 RepID=UPI00391C5785
MQRILHVEEILELLINKKKHDVGKVADVLPFSSRRSKAIRGNFNDILGEYIRKICGTKLKKAKLKDDLNYSENPLVEQIIKEVECGDDEKYDLKRFLEQYLFSQGEEIKPIHPYLFNYVPIANSKHEGELKKHSQFLKDTLIKEEEAVINVFNNKETEDILTELILSKLDTLETKPQEAQYQSTFDVLANYYREDLLFLSKHKDYFLSTFPLLTHFYSFMYICQVLLKFERFEEADYSKADPLYFALEWESISKRRKPADELDGFKRVKDRAQNLFVHVHTISQLSHNAYNMEEGVGNETLRFMNYKELHDIVVHEGKEEAFLQDVKAWIVAYSNWAGVTPKEEPGNLPQAYRTLFNCVKDGTSTEVAFKFGQNIEDVGAALFLKNRGSLGQVLNMNHETLLLITALCVKDKRIPLNQLFEEYEKRGIAFDRYSKKEIMDLLDSLNILDKKSDSGDAQYVKPIL